MFTLFKSPEAVVSHGGFYLHHTDANGITHLLFERTRLQADALYREMFEAFGVEPKLIEVK
jgi:hypothetical protein